MGQHEGVRVGVRAKVSLKLRRRLGRGLRLKPRLGKA